MFQRSVWSPEAGGEQTQLVKVDHYEGKWLRHSWLYWRVHLCLIFLSQPWCVSVRRVGHSHVNIVRLDLEKKGKKQLASSCVVMWHHHDEQQQQIQTNRQGSLDSLITSKTSDKYTLSHCSENKYQVRNAVVCKLSLYQLFNWLLIYIYIYPPFTKNKYN